MFSVFITFLILNTKLSLSFSNDFSCDSDREALIEFYRETNSNGTWIRNDVWLTSFSDHCDWYGIKCGIREDKKRVIGISLKGIKLLGSIPSVLGQLHFLESIELQENMLYGEIGDSLNSLVNLKYFNASQNDIDSVSSNFSIPSLEVLSLSNTKIQIIDRWIGGHSNLEVLELKNIGIYSLPSEIRQLKNLTVLLISFNHGMYLPNDLWGFTNLIVLELEELSLNDNYLNFGSLTKIADLNLSGNNFNFIPSELLIKTSLKRLSLSRNNIRKIGNGEKLFDSLTQFQCQLCELTKFEVSSNSLNFLDLRGNTDLLLNFTKLTNLSQIIYSAHKIFPLSFEALQNLVYLMVEGESVELPTHLPQTIEELFFSMFLGQEFPETLLMNPLPNLQSLTFSFQTYPRPLPLPEIKSINHFPKLSLLRIQGYWEGSIPSSIGYLTSLKTLYISYSYLIGPIPTEIGLLTNLEILNLAMNLKLNGSVPSEIALLKNLNDIVIKSNSMDLELPKELVSLNDGLSTCTLENDPPFFCISDTFYGMSICDTVCDGYSILGKWLNERPSWCLDSLSNATYLQTSVDFLKNQEIETVSDWSFSCERVELSVMTKGHFDIYEMEVVDGNENQVYFKFNMTYEKMYVAFWNENVVELFKFYCGWTFPVGYWGDISSQPCSVITLGVSVKFPSKSECPIFSELGYVDFDNSTLKMGITPIHDMVVYGCEQVPTALSPVELKRGWVCENDHILTTCIPKCGDGIMFDKDCDDGNTKSGDGCSMSCEEERGWDCSKGFCVPICGDGIQVDNEKCDESTIEKKLIIGIVSLCVSVIGLVILVLRKIRKEEDTFFILESEIEREEILGEGNFGRVYKGLWKGTTDVAVKELKTESITEKELREFQREAKLVASLPPHPNIVQFLGILVPNSVVSSTGFSNSLDISKWNASLSKQKMEKLGGLKIVTEHLIEGNMLKFLRPLINENSQTPPYDMMIELGMGIAAGMHHLHSNSIIHRDLAARNILIQTTFKQSSMVGLNDENEKFLKVIPKISDFGLSSSIKFNQVPIRWSAPEILRNEIATYKADVWSFGVVLWEINDGCNEPPYTRMKNSEVKYLVLGGGHLHPKPEFCPLFKSLITSCLSSIPSLRPDFTSLFESLNGEYKKLNETNQLESTTETFPSELQQSLITEEYEPHEYVSYSTSYEP